MVIKADFKKEILSLAKEMARTDINRKWSDLSAREKNNVIYINAEALANDAERRILKAANELAEGEKTISSRLLYGGER